MFCLTTQDDGTVHPAHRRGGHDSIVDNVEGWWNVMRHDDDDGDEHQEMEAS